MKTDTRVNAQGNVNACCGRKNLHSFDCNQGFAGGDTVRDLFTSSHSEGVILGFQNSEVNGKRGAHIKGARKSWFRTLDKIEKIQ